MLDDEEEADIRPKMSAFQMLDMDDDDDNDDDMSEVSTGYYLLMLY